MRRLPGWQNSHLKDRETPPHQDLAHHMGKDSVLDSLLSTTELSQGICDIETTDTFEEHDPDERSDASRKKSDHGNLPPFVHPAKKKYGNAPVLDNMISRNICMPTVTRRDMSCAERGHVLTKYTQDVDNLEAKAGISPDKMNRCCGSDATAICF